MTLTMSLCLKKLIMNQTLLEYMIPVLVITVVKTVKIDDMVYAIKRRGGIYLFIYLKNVVDSWF